MAWLQGCLAVYGLLNIALGALAFSKSPVSFYAGGGAGLLALIGAWYAGRNPKIGFAIGTVVCLAILGRFGPKQLSEFQLYPGFILVAASAVMLGLLIYGHFAYRRQERNGS
ncbi:MAG TPA: TMEM14 family protein [Fimbriimonadaceae bacterium]|nr:TMEM14 family protein [Fimbriimonadaceae bacterium]